MQQKIKNKISFFKKKTLLKHENKRLDAHA
jgi:hypothetical protein